jgi:hypothetical protein
LDQAILMIPILCAATTIAKHPRPSIVTAFVAGNVVMAALVVAGLADQWLLWSAPLWALLYSSATRSAESMMSHVQAESVGLR